MRYQVSELTRRQTASANTTARAICPTLFLRIEERNSSKNAFGVSSIAPYSSAFSQDVQHQSILADGILSLAELRLKRWQMGNPKTGFGGASRRRLSKGSRAPIPPCKSIRRDFWCSYAPPTGCPSAAIMASI